MPNNRMKRIFLRGLLWLFLLLEFGFMALSLEPGFLDFDNLPDTNFSCVGKVIGGYYADLETNCQMFHVCTIGQLDEPMDIRFLCLNGTVFDQETRVCERIDEVDCSKSEQFYSLNLELYGNTQPPILEDSPETEQPLIIKSTTTTSTTTSKPKASNTPFYTSSKPPSITTQTVGHHFTLGNSPDIRFNPEEINISLHPGAPPDIRTKPVTYQQQSYSDNNKKIVVTTHSENSDNKKVSVTTHSEVLPSEDILDRQSTKKPQSHNPHTIDQSFQHPTPGDINYEFTFHQTEPNQQDYHTELPQSFFHSDFHSDQDFSGPLNQQLKSSTFNDDYTPTTKGRYQPKVATTIRNFFLDSLKPPAPNQPNHYSDHQTEKPQRLQLPLPLLPTLPPLTFSSPAPFSLQRHIDAKRYTKDHQSPPRIVISASASVSDASGRRLNYSLGTIGAGELLEQPPQSYDEYKDEDVGLDPFYHDVPKLKRSRSKRSANAKIKHTDIIKNEQEAVDVLKFLFDWYKNHEKTAVASTTVPTDIVSDQGNSTTPQASSTTLPSSVSTTQAVETDITAEASDAGVSNENKRGGFETSALFNRNSKYSIIGNDTTVSTDAPTTTKITTAKTTTTTATPEILGYERDFLDELFGSDDYVNDNYEPIAYDQKYKENEKDSVNQEDKVKEAKSQVLPKDYVDDNIEPIYYRSGNGNEQNKEKEQELADITDKESKPDETITFSPSPSISTKPTEEVKEITTTKSTTEAKQLPVDSIEVGDTQINDITQNIPNRTTTNDSISSTETSTNPYEATNFSEPKSEILEPVTTEKTVTYPIRQKSNRRRGRKRYFTTTEKVKEKEPEYKKVVLEKITEKAHTAKDDFNYLRTLYKVHTTTPTYSAPGTKEKHDVTDLKESEVLTTVTEVDESETTPYPQDTVPVITSEATTTTTENNIPSTTTTTTEQTLVSSTSTTERILTPVLTTTETLVSRRRSSRRRGRNRDVSESQTTQASRVRSHRRGHSRRKLSPHHDTTETPTPNPNDSYTNIPQNVPVNSTGKVNTDVIHDETVSSTAKPDEIPSSTEISSKTEIPTIVDTSNQTNKDIFIEENGSNAIGNYIRYPKSYTDYIPTLLIPEPTEPTEFLNQLTLNYKKIFEEVVQIPEPTVPDISNVATSAVTEEYGNVASASVKSLDLYRDLDIDGKSIDDVNTQYENFLPPSTAVSKRRLVKENIDTAVKLEENTSISPNQVKIRQRTGETEVINTRKSTTTEAAPTTEESVKEKVAPQSTPSPSPYGSSAEEAVYISTTTEESRQEKIIPKLSPSVSDHGSPSDEEPVSASLTTEGSVKKEIISRLSPSLSEHGGLSEVSVSRSSTTEESVREQIIPKLSTSLSAQNDSLEESVSTLTTTEESVKEKIIPKLSPSHSIQGDSFEEPVLTLSTTEESVKEKISSQLSSSHTHREASPELSEDKAANGPAPQTTTQSLTDDSRTTEVVPTISVTTENIHIQQQYPVTTEKSIQESALNTQVFNPTPGLTTIDLHQEETYQTTSDPIRHDATSIPKITEIFNLPGISKDQNIFETVSSLTLLTGEYLGKASEASIQSDTTSSNQQKRDDNFTTVAPVDPDIVKLNNKTVDSTEKRMDGLKEENLPTEDYANTVFVLRTTENAQKQLVNNADQTEEYPSIIHIIRTTESPKIEAEEKSLTRQLSTDRLQKLIEEIEENTKSVVATTVAPTTTNFLSITTTDKLSEDYFATTTERRDDLQELTSLFQNSYFTTTPLNILSASKESTTETAEVTETTNTVPEESPTVPSIIASDPDLMSTSQIERLTKTERPLTTTPETSSSRRRGNGRRGGRRRNPEARRHRFSTESFTRRPEGRRQTIEEEIVDELTKNSRGATTESSRRRVRVKPKNREEYSTDAPLQKSASPTRAERTRESLPTTPLSNEGNGRRYFIFNCFGKEVDKFYPDPRDCRLFHYCTQGYSKNQLIDMKFVCDLNTYFDDAKLICSKRKPSRCL